MRYRHFLLLTVFALAMNRPSVAMAGMPSITLTDWAQMRIETISFFVVVLLVLTLVVKWLWNSLAKDFPKLPRLGYRKTLAAVLLFGMMLAVVLTMIAGARELLTPGAWQKQGVLYRVGSQASPPPADAKHLAERTKHLENLRSALWDYAARHDGRFPVSDNSAEVPAALWEAPSGAGIHYLYVSGLSADDSPRVLVYEPELYDQDRLLLRTNGEIVVVPTAELRKQLPEKKP
jgi:hypothetical protein